MKISVVLIFMTFTLFAGNAYSDTVETVYSCGDDVGIKTVADGWLVVKTSDVGQARVDRIMSIALTLISTQKAIGYYNSSAPGAWCGIPDAKTITVLAITAG